MRFTITYMGPPPTGRTHLGAELLARLEFASASDLLANLPQLGDIFAIKEGSTRMAMSVGRILMERGLLGLSKGDPQAFLAAEVWLEH